MARTSKIRDIFDAAGTGNVDVLNSFLANGVDPNILDNDKLTPIHYATGFGHVEAVVALIAAGAKVNVSNPEIGYIPLMYSRLRIFKEWDCRRAMVTNRQNDRRSFDIDPDLGEDFSGLASDVKVCCLAYLADWIVESKIGPAGATFAVVRTFFLGGVDYPCIGMSRGTSNINDDGMQDIAFSLADRVSEYVLQIGLNRILELSSAHTLKWSEIPPFSSRVW